MVTRRNRTPHRGSEGAKTSSSGPRHGDREAFGVAGPPTSDRMYAIATRILRDSDLAEDALQGALITAWRELPDAPRPGPLRGLGPASCSSMPATPRPGVAGRGRQTFGSCRSTGRRVRTTLLSVADRDASIGRSGGSRSSSARSSSCITTSGLPLVEIAESLGIPAGTARSRLHYATRVLRAAIEADAAPVAYRRTDGMTTRSRLRPDRPSLARRRARRGAGPRDRRRPPGRRDDAAERDDPWRWPPGGQHP